MATAVSMFLMPTEHQLRWQVLRYVCFTTIRKRKGRKEKRDRVGREGATEQVNSLGPSGTPHPRLPHPRLVGVLQVH